MDLNKALQLWPALGADYSIVSEDLLSGYMCWFIKDREVVGEMRAKGGWYWNYPQELLDKSIELRDADIDWFEYVHGHKCDFDIFQSQSSAARDGHYVQMMKCVCGKVKTFDLNLYT